MVLLYHKYRLVIRNNWLQWSASTILPLPSSACLQMLSRILWTEDWICSGNSFRESAINVTQQRPWNTPRPHSFQSHRGVGEYISSRYRSYKRSCSALLLDSFRTPVTSSIRPSSSVSSGVGVYVYDRREPLTLLHSTFFMKNIFFYVIYVLKQC